MGDSRGRQDMRTYILADKQGSALKEYTEIET